MSAPLPPATPNSSVPWEKVALLLVSVGLLVWLGIWAWRSSERGRIRDEGLSLAAKGDFKSAEPLLLESLENGPNDIEVIKALVFGYARANHPEQALPMIERWQALAPDNLEPIATRFRMRIQQKHFDEATADAEFLLQAGDLDSDLPLPMADTFWRAGRLGEAEKAARMGITANPGDVGLRLVLAEILHARHELTAASEHLARLLADRPELAKAWKLQGMVVLDQGDPIRAIPMFEKCLRLDPGEVNGRYHLALALARAGKSEEARREMTRYEKTRVAIDMANVSFNQPENLELGVRTAAAMFEVGLNAEGHTFLRQVLDREPQHVEAKRLLDSQLDSRPK